MPHYPILGTGHPQPDAGDISSVLSERVHTVFYKSYIGAMDVSLII